MKTKRLRNTLSKIALTTTLATVMGTGITMFPTKALADNLPTGVVTLNNFELNKKHIVPNQQSKDSLAYYSEDLKGYIVNLKSSNKETPKIRSIGNLYAHDEVRVDSSKPLEEIKLLLGDIESIIFNNTDQYITLTFKSDKNLKSTLKISDINQYLCVRQGLLNLFDKSLTNVREGDEILQIYHIDGLKESNKSLTQTSIFDYEIKVERNILRVRNQIYVKNTSECAKQVRLTLSSKDTNNVEYTSYINLPELQNGKDKQSKVLNISDSDKPNLNCSDNVYDWTILDLDDMIQQYQSNTNVNNADLCIYISYEDKEGHKPIGGNIDFIRIRSEKSKVIKHFNKRNAMLSAGVILVVISLEIGLRKGMLRKKKEENKK